MHQLYRSFTVLAWRHGLDAFISQGLLCLHHVLVRLFMGPDFHAQLGTYLSLVYFLVFVSNAGLDQAVGPFLHHYSAHQKSARSLGFSILGQWVTIMMVLSGLYHIRALWCHYAFFAPLQKDSLLIILASVTILCESIKRTLKIFLQLTLHTLLPMSVEIVGMTSYLCIFWMSYAFGKQISLKFSVVILCTVSLLQIIAFLPAIWLWFKGLPHALPASALDNTLDNTLDKHISAKFKRTRLALAFHQTSVQLCSSNFLIPRLTTTLSPHYLSLYKIGSTLAHWISTVLYKAFGLSTAIILAHATQESLGTRTAFFKTITWLFFQVTLAIFLVSCLHSACLNLSLESFYFIITVIGLSFVDGLILLYDKWYCAENKSLFLTVLTSVHIFLLCMLIGTYSIDPRTLIHVIMLLRCIHLLTLVTGAWYLWKLAIPMSWSNRQA